MTRRMKLIGVAAAALLVGAAGTWTNGLPYLSSTLVNGTSYASKGIGVVSQLDPGQINNAGVPNCCGPFVPVDTNLAGGASPQSVGATPFQVAMTLLSALANTQTSTVHAATSNTLGGVVITEALATAPGATYTFTLTNSLITAAYISSGAVPSVGIYSISNTGGTSANRNSATMQLTNTTMAAGSVTWTWINNGNTALNGTMYIGWDL